MIQHCHLVSTFMTGLLTHSLTTCAISDTVLSDYISEQQDQNRVWVKIPPLKIPPGHPSIANWGSLEELAGVKLFYA